jgi:hypothetical protein
MFRGITPLLEVGIKLEEDDNESAMYLRKLSLVLRSPQFVRLIELFIENGACSFDLFKRIIPAAAMRRLRPYLSEASKKISGSAAETPAKGPTPLAEAEPFVS